MALRTSTRAGRGRAHDELADRAVAELDLGGGDLAKGSRLEIESMETEQ